MNGYRKPLFVLSCAGLFCCSFISMEEKQYLDHVLKSYSAELFRNQRFTLLKAKATYGWKNLNRVELCYSCYRFMDVAQARALIMEIAHQVLQRINEDPLLDQQGFFSGGHFCVADLRIEIKVDNYISRSTDASEGVKTILLDSGNITYTTFTSSPYISTGAHVVKEAYRDVLFLVPGEPNAAREMDQNLQRALLENAELGVIEEPITTVEINVMPSEKESLLLKTNELSQPTEAFEAVIENIETINRLHVREQAQQVEQYTLPEEKSEVEPKSQHEQNQLVEPQTQEPGEGSKSKEPNLDDIFESRQLQGDDTSIPPAMTETNPSTSSTTKSVLPKTLVPVTPQETQKPVSLNEEMENDSQAADTVVANHVIASGEEVEVSDSLLDKVVQPEVECASFSGNKEIETEDLNAVFVDDSIPNNSNVEMLENTSLDLNVSDDAVIDRKDVNQEIKETYLNREDLSDSGENKAFEDEVGREIDVAIATDSKDLQNTNTAIEPEQKKTSFVQKFFRFFSAKKEADGSIPATVESEQEPSFFERIFGKKKIRTKDDDDITREEAQKKKEILLNRLLHNEGTFEQVVAQEDSGLELDEEVEVVSLEQKQPSFFTRIFRNKIENNQPDLIKDSAHKSVQEAEVSSGSFFQSLFGGLEKKEPSNAEDSAAIIADSSGQNEQKTPEKSVHERSFFSRVFGDQSTQKKIEDENSEKSESTKINTVEEMVAVDDFTYNSQASNQDGKEENVVQNDESGNASKRSIFSKIFGNQKSQQEAPEEKTAEPISDVIEPSVEEQVVVEEVVLDDEDADIAELDVDTAEEDDVPAKRSIFSKIFGNQKSQQEAPEEKTAEPISDVIEPSVEEQVVVEEVVLDDEDADMAELDVDTAEEDDVPAKRSIFSKIFGNQKSQQEAPEEKTAEPISDVIEPSVEEQVVVEEVVLDDEGADIAELDVDTAEEDDVPAKRSIFSKIFGNQKSQQEAPEEKTAEPISDVIEPSVEEQVVVEEVVLDDEGADIAELDVDTAEEDDVPAKRSIFSKIFGNQKSQQEAPEEKTAEPISDVIEPSVEEQVVVEEVVLDDEDADMAELDVDTAEEDDVPAKRSIFSKIFGNQKTEAAPDISVNAEMDNFIEEAGQQDFQGQQESTKENEAKQQFLKKIFGLEGEMVKVNELSSPVETEQELDTFEFDGDITEEEAADLKNRLLERIAAHQEGKTEQSNRSSQEDSDSDFKEPSKKSIIDNSTTTRSFFHMSTPERKEFELADEYEDDNGDSDEDPDQNNENEEYLGFNQN